MALNHFMEYHEDGKKIKSPECAREQLRKYDRYKNSIYNYIPSSSSKWEAMAKEVEELYKRCKGKDVEEGKKAQYTRENYRYYFKREIPGHQYGADRAIGNFVSHLRKGCLCDPLPCREMSSLASDNKPKDGGPPKLKRRQGTNVVENNNKYGARATVDHVNRQRSSLTHRKFMMFTHAFNLKCDANIEHITKKKARTRDWFLQEVLSQELVAYVEGPLFEAEDYPLPYEKKEHFEPVGEEYLKHDAWEKIDRELSVSRCSLLEAGVNTEEAASTNLPTSSKNPAPAMTAAATTVAPPDSTTVALSETAPTTTVVPPTEDDAVASGLPVGAAGSEPAKKKVRTDFGFGAERWGNRLGGNPVWTMHNTYIHSKDLEGRQREALFMAYQHITKVHGRALPQKELYKRVADLFNIWHIGLVENDGYGYGGKIGEKVVEQCFKKEGRSILQGSLGGRVIPQAAAMPIPQPVMLERGPTQPGLYRRRVASSAKPSLTGKEIEILSQRDARAKLKELVLSQNGTVSELKGRLKKHYRV